MRMKRSMERATMWNRSCDGVFGLIIHRHLKSNLLSIFSLMP